MPPKKQLKKKSSESDIFQQNIAKWIKITDEIISLEAKLKELREEQFNISKSCVDQTANILI